MDGSLSLSENCWPKFQLVTYVQTDKRKGIVFSRALDLWPCQSYAYNEKLEATFKLDSFLAQKWLLEYIDGMTQGPVS